MDSVLITLIVLAVLGLSVYGWAYSDVLFPSSRSFRRPSKAAKK